MSLRKIIRESIEKLLSEETPKEIFYTIRSVSDPSFSIQKSDWQPLYNYLEQVFGDKYLEAADSFMYYEKNNFFDGKYEISTYRNGITRKYLLLDDEGNPYEINWKHSHYYHDRYPNEIKKISIKDAFDKVYEGLENYVNFAYKDNPEEAPEDYYLLKYSKFREPRDLALKKAGFKVMTTNKPEDIDNISDLEEVKKKRKKNPNLMATPTGSIFFMDAAVSGISENKKTENKKNKKKVLTESLANRKVPKTFDHLKWSLNQQQKHFLQDFIDTHPDTMKESDYEYASKITGIPAKNVKSIQNTYGSWNGKSDELDPQDINSYGKFAYGKGDVFNAKDYDFPQKYRNDVVNFKTISKDEADNLRYPKKSLRQRKYESDLAGSIGGSVRKSDVKRPEDNYDEWLKYYIVGEAKPKDCRLNKEKNQIEVDFEPSDDYYDFHKSMLNSNKKSKFWISVESLINQFNDAFGTYYMIDDQYDLTQAKSNCIRLVVKEISTSDKMLWDSDSKTYIPWEYAPEDLRKQHLAHKSWNLAKPAPSVDFNELLYKYLNFHHSMFQGL